MTLPTIAVDREVLIRARAATVFRYFTDPQRFASWFGAGSSIEPRPGGAVVVAFPGGAEARGEVLAVEPERRVEFTWGYPGDESPLPVGSTTVVITLDEHDEGTTVRLTHTVGSDEMRLAHVAGWRHHLSHLATLATRDHRSGAAATADAWFDLWTEEDDEKRRDGIEALCAGAVELVDDLVSVTGADDIAGHIANARQHLAGITPVREGPPAVVADQISVAWGLRRADGDVVGTGRTVFTVDLEGRVSRVVGFWDTDPDDVARAVYGGAVSASASARDDEPPESVPLEPHIWVRDIDASVRWYTEVLGFTIEARYPAEGPLNWVWLVRGGAAVMLAEHPRADTATGTQAYVAAVESRSSHGGPLALYLAVDGPADLDRIEAAAKDLLEPRWDPWWGGTQFTVADPDGIWWTVRTG